MIDYRIDILDSSGTVVGDGPLISVVDLSDVKRLDAVGEAQFTIPAEDARTQYIAEGAQFDLYDRVDGYLGRYYYASKQLEVANGQARLVVSCWDQLTELTRRSVYFRRTYTSEDVADVVDDLVTGVAGWSTDVDAGIGNTTVTYEGESVLLAVDVLRDRRNKHYRLGGTRVLEFGAFGDDSEIVLANLRGQVQGEIAQNTNVALVEQVRLVEEADEVFNYIVPLGAGQGLGQLTIETATLGDYAVQTGTNEDGSNYFYIADATSIAAYGQRDKVLSFPTIRPITNSDANIENAANALKLTAETYLARHLVPRVTYAVSVRALRQTVQVGDTVRLQYRGIVDGYAFIDVDDDFYVMDVKRTRSQDGTRRAVLTISTLAVRRTSDTDVVLEVIHDLRALKVSVPITISKDRVGPYIRRMNASNAAEFTVSVGDEVLQLNYAKLRFRTSPLKASVTTVSTDAGSSPTSSSGGGATSSSDGSHTHTVTISDHTHTVTISSHTHSVTTNNHTHTVQVIDVGTLEGTPVYFNETYHYFNSTLTSGTDVVTGSASGGETVSSASGGSSTPTSSSGGSATPTSSSGGSHNHTVSNHTHTVTIPAHNHTLTYGLYADTNYPQVISLSINSVDVTVALGGTWAPTNATVEQEVDITDYLVEAVGGLRQHHRISFSCTTGQGEIEMEVNMLLTIQAIAIA